MIAALIMNITLFWVIFNALHTEIVLALIESTQELRNYSVLACLINHGEDTEDEDVTSFT